MKMYRVSWMEEHSVTVDAENEDEAYEQAINEDQPDSLDNIETLDITEVLKND